MGDDGEDDEPAAGKGDDDSRLQRLEKLVEEMNERLKAMEKRMPAKP